MRIATVTSGETVGLSPSEPASRQECQRELPLGPAAGQPSLLPLARPAPPPLTDQEREFLLGTARASLLRFVTRAQRPADEDVPARLKEKRGCFVTLTQGGALRGCVGRLLPDAPLYLAVSENVCGAASRDPRFPPVRAGELEEINIEISVLTDLQPLRFSTPEELLDSLRPFQDGVLLRLGLSVATFLPKVWRQLPDKAEFLSHLALKAGAPSSAWRTREADVSVYQVECFAEPEPGCRGGISH